MIRESAYRRAPNGAGSRRRSPCSTAAIGGDAELRLQAPEVAYAALRGFADLLVGNGVAYTDVHGALDSSYALADIEAQMRMIRNSVSEFDGNL